MTVIVVPFESPVQREERLYLECEEALETHSMEQTEASREALQEAVRRWEAARIKLRLRKNARPTAGVSNTAA